MCKHPSPPHQTPSPTPFAMLTPKVLSHVSWKHPFRNRGLINSCRAGGGGVPKEGTMIEGHLTQIHRHAFSISQSCSFFGIFAFQRRVRSGRKVRTVCLVLRLAVLCLTHLSGKPAGDSKTLKTTIQTTGNPIVFTWTLWSWKMTWTRVSASPNRTRDRSGRKVNIH